MATKTLNTRIILRNDSTVNWNGEQAEILKKGEVGLEFLTNGKVKMKVGDGKSTWAELAYIGGDEAQVYQTVATDKESDEEAIRGISWKNDLNPGDIAIIKRNFAINKATYTAYVYNGTQWEAMDGNYNAENVYFNKNLTLTASIGVQKVPENGSKTIETTGKNLKEVLDMLVASESEPSTTLPSATITLTQAGSYEVGTTVTPSYSISFEDGNYSTASGEATGVMDNSWTVTDSKGATKNTKTGSFDSFVVADGENYTVSTTVGYTDGNVPKTNLGNECASKQIKAGTTSKATSKAVKGYRNTYYAVIDDVEKLTSDKIRTMTASNNPSTIYISSHSGAKRVVVAVPEGGKTIKKVMKTDGLATEITAAYVKQASIQVADKRGGINGLKNYNIWVYQPASIDAAEKHTITLS